MKTSMADMVKRIEFWLALVIVLAIKLTSQDKTTPRQKLLTVGIAVGSAILFTESVLDFLTLDKGIYEVPVSALIALSSEHLARQILNTSFVDAIRAFRGTGKK